MKNKLIKFSLFFVSSIFLFLYVLLITYLFALTDLHIYIKEVIASGFTKSEQFFLIFAYKICLYLALPIIISFIQLKPKSEWRRLNILNIRIKNYWKRFSYTICYIYLSLLFASAILYFTGVNLLFERIGLTLFENVDKTFFLFGILITFFIDNNYSFDYKKITSNSNLNMRG